MKIKDLKARIENLNDDCEVFVVHGGTHLPIAALIGSTDEEENLQHGFGLLTGNREVMMAYVDKMESMIRSLSPDEASEWQDRLDFWTHSLDAKSLIKPKRQHPHNPIPVLEAEIVEAPKHAHSK